MGRPPAAAAGHVRLTLAAEVAVAVRLLGADGGATVLAGTIAASLLWISCDAMDADGACACTPHGHENDSAKRAKKEKAELVGTKISGLCPIRFLRVSLGRGRLSTPQSGAFLTNPGTFATSCSYKTTTEREESIFSMDIPG